MLLAFCFCDKLLLLLLLSFCFCDELLLLLLLSELCICDELLLLLLLLCQKTKRVALLMDLEV